MGIDGWIRSAESVGTPNVGSINCRSYPFGFMDLLVAPTEPLLALLWRFHQLHHADQAMDVTTGSRFHMVEIGLSSFLRVPVLIALGATMGELAVYEISMFLVVLFHHANIALLERADRTLRLFIVTPMMNKVHHSIRRVEADSNYGSLFTWWDRWFGSWKILQAGRRIQFGVEE